MITSRKALSIILLIFPHSVKSHGYLKSPRSRNWVAKEDGKWSGGTKNDPEVETCPHCLNRNSATCGKNGANDYDYPTNALGGPMPINIQAKFSQGQEVELTAVLTAHHKGHFEYKACPIKEGEVATQSCFDQNPLEFVRDVLYPEAPKDPSFPQRAYIPLTSHSTYKDEGGSYIYTHVYKLPKYLSGDIVLLQWHYITANSCLPIGYDNVAWSEGFFPGHLPTCGPLPPDGNGTPEQFWNCAEVQIKSSASVPTTAPTLRATSSSSKTSSPTSSPIITATKKPHTPSPTTDKPVQPGSCPLTYTGLYPTTGCTGFINCDNGNLISSPVPCPEGLLFNEQAQYCDWPYNVKCSI